MHKGTFRRHDPRIDECVIGDVPQSLTIGSCPRRFVQSSATPTRACAAGSAVASPTSKPGCPTNGVRSGSGGMADGNCSRAAASETPCGSSRRLFGSSAGASSLLRVDRKVASVALYRRSQGAPRQRIATGSPNAGAGRVSGDRELDSNAPTYFIPAQGRNQRRGTILSRNEV
jgi:hypothetical protein